MKQMKRWLSALLILALALALLPGSVRRAQAANVTYTESGRTSVKRLTMAELKQKYAAIPTYDKLYATEPVITGSDYRPAVLTKQAYAATLGWINYYRASVGVTEVSFSSDANSSAAYGALCLAMLDQLTHYPSQPSNMSDADFKIAYNATSTSNISYSSGFSIDKVLPVAVQGQMEDEDVSNIYRVGHRRWLLNPDVQTMGVGSANNGSAHYTDIKVFGTGVTDQKVSDYDFIAWPASGDNLSDTFKRDTPWSITLNPSKYGNADRSKVKITLTRKSDGKVWTFNQNTEYSTIGPGLDYFTVNTGGIGSAHNATSCIIFRPAYEDFTDYAGEYTVDVTGLTNTSGKAKELHYKVNFGAYKDPSTYTYEVGWAWDSNFKWAQARFYCIEDSGRTVTVNAEITKEIIWEEGETVGTAVYTATVTGPDGKTYQDQVKVNVYQSREITRLYGSTRYETSFLLADQYKGALKKSRFDYIVVASGTNFPDALSGSYLASKVKAPILMAGPKKTQLDRLLAYIGDNLSEDGLVYILGGPTAVSEEFDALLTENRIKFKRLAGKTRYDTNLEILKEAGVSSYQDILVCTGKSYPDALSASATGKPILMVNEKLTKTQKEFLAGVGFSFFTVIGGEKAVTAQVEKELRNYGIVGQRLAGKTRYETSVLLARAFFSMPSVVTLAYGENFPDGLCAGPLAYYYISPVIMTKTGSTKYAKEYVNELASVRLGFITGGSGLINDDAVRSVFGMEDTEEIKEIYRAK